MTLGRLAVRTTIGGLFAAHGTQKLLGWFGGGGIEGTTQMFSGIGLHPPKVHAIAAGATEAAGGAALVLGAATPLACGSLIATMLTAIRTVHGANGPWATKGGWEYNAVLIAALALLADVGPGSPALGDGEERGGGGAALALGLGLAGAASAKALSDALAPKAAKDAPPAPAPTDA